MSGDSPPLSSSAEHEEGAIESLGRFDVVRVRQAVPDHGLAGGEQGTIVDVLDDPERAYLVDFSGGSRIRRRRTCPWSFLTPTKSRWSGSPARAVDAPPARPPMTAQAPTSR